MYMESFGVKDTAGEFLRLQYLTIGFYFLIFLASLMAISVTLVGAHRQRLNELESRSPSANHSRDRQHKEQQQPRRDSAKSRFIQALYRYLLFLIVIALVFGFGEFPHDKRPIVLLLAFVCLTLLGTVLISRVAQGVSQLKNGHGVSETWRTLRTGVYQPPKPFLGHALFVILFVLGFVILPMFHVRIRQLAERAETYLFVILLVMLGYVLYHSFFRRRGLPEKDHRMFMGTRIALILSLYYLCVLSFAYGIYPLMSASKGGGYFGDAGRVALVLRENERPLPDKLMDKAGRCNRTIELVLIEHEPNVLYVADPSDDGGADKWIRAAFRPTVYEVQMADILSVEHRPAPALKQQASRIAGTGSPCKAEQQ
jgi:hypothetical protein